jgi:hypothetical protein
VKHSLCSSLIKDLYECDGIDVVLGFGCPETNPPGKITYALNVSERQELRTGDTASTFGFINPPARVGRFWSGTLAGKLGPVNNSSIELDPDEYVFQGVAQIRGMSGGATVNGLGYTGMVHAINEFKEDGVSTALVVPFHSIHQCLLTSGKSNLEDKWRYWNECPNLVVVDFPSSHF